MSTMTELHPCYCPPDCGCRPSNFRRNVCGCEAHDGLDGIHPGDLFESVRQTDGTPFTFRVLSIVPASRIAYTLDEDGQHGQTTTRHLMRDERAGHVRRLA